MSLHPWIHWSSTNLGPSEDWGVDLRGRWRKSKGWMWSKGVYKIWNSQKLIKILYFKVHCFLFDSSGRASMWLFYKRHLPIHLYLIFLFLLKRLHSAMLCFQKTATQSTEGCVHTKISPNTVSFSRTLWHLSCWENFWLHYNTLFFLKIGSHYITLAGLELAM